MVPKNLGNQIVLGSQLAKSVELIDGNHLSLNETTLDGQDLVLLCELADDTGGSDGIAGGHCESGGTIEHLIEIIAVVAASQTGQGVLYNSVINTGLTELGTELRILSHGDTLVIYKNTSGSALDLLGKSRDSSLLCFKNLSVRHLYVTSRKNVLVPEQYEDTKDVNNPLCFLGRMGNPYGKSLLLSLAALFIIPNRTLPVKHKISDF